MVRLTRTGDTIRGFGNVFATVSRAVLPTYGSMASQREGSKMRGCESLGSTCE